MPIDSFLDLATVKDVKSFSKLSACIVTRLLAYKVSYKFAESLQTMRNTMSIEYEEGIFKTVGGSLVVTGI